MNSRRFTGFPPRPSIAEYSRSGPGIAAKAATHVPSWVQEPDADGITPCHQPIAVVFDLVDPVGASRKTVAGEGRQAGLNKTGEHGRGNTAPSPPEFESAGRRPDRFPRSAELLLSLRQGADLVVGADP
jgi:hypothetical protein